MSSDTHQRFAAALTPWGDSARIGLRLSGGHRNDVREVWVGGVRYAGRLSPRSSAAIEWELDLLHDLHRAGLRVPLPHSTPNGRRVVDGLVLFGWLDGTPPSSDRDWSDVAATLQRLHQLTQGWPQRPGFRSTRELLTINTGGDVRLDQMPPNAVRLCRAAWRELDGEPQSVVHGDPGAANIRISAEGIGLLDWDEARVDASILDLAALPPGQSYVPPTRLAAARRALDTWETANGRVIEPHYARRLLLQLRSHTQRT